MSHVVPSPDASAKAELPNASSSSAQFPAVLPFGLQLDDADTPVDVLDAMVLSSFVTGTQPWARGTRLSRVRPEATLIPPGAQVLRVAAQDRQEAKLAIGDGWTLRSVRWRSGGAYVTVTAISEELARSVLEQATDGAEEATPESDAVTMGFWHATQRGPQRNARAISAPTWNDVRTNYSSAPAGQLERLMAVGPEDVDGRLILLHGPPGTGKTTALRALAYAWRTWCQVDCVLDPDRLFESPGYLMEVAVGEDDAGDRRWRLLVLEDCDELVRHGAKQASGQALSRLLNLTDGLLGQGRDVLVAITTNEDIARLHPAITRPGRCLAKIEIGRLSTEESANWLATKADPATTPLAIPGPATLAELYAMRAGRIDDLTESTPVGGYL